MSTAHLVPDDLRALYEVSEWRNAAGVLSTARPQEWADIIDVLRAFRLYKADISTPGGSKSLVASRIDGALFSRGWKETKFKTAIQVDEQSFPSPTHLVDCFKNRVALEVEWNNKDPFYDRDLNNFRLLFDLRVIDAGVIVTRSSELQDIFKQLGRGASFGPSTTHMDKLRPRLEGGSGGGCPILVFAITKALYSLDTPPPLAPPTRSDEDDHDSE
jgi:hypothetical protein